MLNDMDKGIKATLNSFREGTIYMDEAVEIGGYTVVMHKRENGLASFTVNKP